MKRAFVQAVAVLTLAGGMVLPVAAHAEGMGQEEAQHPRIRKAIDNLEDAIHYLESAPHDFGGHKAEALRASREAVRQLRFALEFRAMQDTRHGR